HARVLLQAAQGVRVPLLAERDVDPEPVPLADEPGAEAFRDAEQHLELVFLRPEAAPPHDPASFVDEALVVRRDADVTAAVEERLERAQEVGAHLLVALEGDLLRLDVDALAETDVRPQVG